MTQSVMQYYSQLLWQQYSCFFVKYLLDIWVYNVSHSLHVKQIHQAYHQTFYAWRQTLSSYCGCSSQPGSQTPICSAGSVYPPSQMCSRCIPEDRHAGVHLRETDSDIFTPICTKGFSFSKGWAESLIQTLFCDSHHWTYQRGTGCNKWKRIIFVANLLSCETQSSFDMAVHTPHAGFLLISAQSLP